MGQNTIVSVGNRPSASGMPASQHIFYAVNAALWWCVTFKDTSTTTLYTYSSPDLVTWTARGTLTITATSEGRSLGTWYQNVSSHDVVHIVYMETNIGSTSQKHVRATISGTTITFGSIVANGIIASSTPSDTVGGFCTCLDSAAHPIDLNPPSVTGDPGVWRSGNADTGSAWTTGMGTGVQLAGPVNESNSGCLIPLASGGHALALYDDGSSTSPQTLTNVQASTWNGTSWTANGSQVNIFTTLGTSVDASQWHTCRVSDTDVHCVLASGTNTFTHKRWNGTNWTTVAGAAIGNQSFLAGGGVCMYTDGTTAWLFCINSAAGNDITYNKWTSNSWSGWTNLGLGSATRNCLSISRTNDGTNIALLWVEGASTPFNLVTIGFAVATSTDSASGAWTWPAPKMAAAASQTQASGGWTFPAPVMAATELEQAAAGALTVPAPKMAAVAVETFSATSALTYPAPLVAAAAVETFSASSALTWPAPLLAAAVQEQAAAGAFVWPTPILAAVVVETFSASSGWTWPAPLMAAVESEQAASGAITYPAPQLSAVAVETFSASGAWTWPAPLMASTVSISGGTTTASGAWTWPAPLLAATEQEQAAAAVLTLGTPVMAASATETFTASAAFTLGTPVMAAVEQEQAAAGAFTLGTLVLAASAVETFTAAGALTVPPVQLAAVESEQAGGAIWTWPTPRLAAAGVETFSAAGALTVPAPAFGAAATETFTAAGVLTLPAPALAGVGTETFSAAATFTLGTSLLGAAESQQAGLGALTLPAPILAGTATAHGTTSPPYSATLTLSTTYGATLALAAAYGAAAALSQTYGATPALSQTYAATPALTQTYAASAALSG